MQHSLERVINSRQSPHFPSPTVDPLLRTQLVAFKYAIIIKICRTQLAHINQLISLQTKNMDEKKNNVHPTGRCGKEEVASYEQLLDIQYFTFYFV